MREYEKTHPWLTFKVDLSSAPPELWMLLGEARSKCDHLAGVPLRPSTADEMHQIYLAKGVLATTAIEGNTLSEHEVQQLLQKELHLPRSKQYLGVEVQNIVNAVNIIVKERINSSDGVRLSTSSLERFNGMVLKGLTVADHVRPGHLRDYSVGVANYRGAPARDLKYLLDRMCDWLNDENFEPNQDHGIAPAVIRAVLAHLYLAWIHAFGDGNGRTARLVEFEILVSAGVPTPAAHLLSNHYNQTRGEYYRQLERASGSGGDVIPFLVYAVRGFVDQLREQIEHVRKQQLDVAWRNFVYESYKDAAGATQRQRDLVLDMSRAGRPLSRAEIRDVSPRVARQYANRTMKTVDRDLRALERRQLVLRSPEGYVANIDLIRAFLPRKRVKTHSKQASAAAPPPVSDAATVH